MPGLKAAHLHHLVAVASPLRSFAVTALSAMAHGLARSPSGPVAALTADVPSDDIDARLVSATLLYPRSETTSTTTAAGRPRLTTPAATWPRRCSHIATLAHRNARNGSYDVITSHGCPTRPGGATVSSPDQPGMMNEPRSVSHRSSRTYRASG